MAALAAGCVNRKFGQCERVRSMMMMMMQRAGCYTAASCCFGRSDCTAGLNTWSSTLLEDGTTLSMPAVTSLADAFEDAPQHRPPSCARSATTATHAHKSQPLNFTPQAGRMHVPW